MAREKIRIGKDIKLEWQIKVNEQTQDLSQFRLRLEIKHPIGVRENLAFRVSNDKVIADFYGINHRHLGPHTLTLWRNYGEIGQTAVDSVDAFILVATTDEESPGVSGSLTSASVKLTGSMAVGVKGLSAYEIWLQNGHKGTEADFINWIRQPSVDAAKSLEALGSQLTADNNNRKNEFTQMQAENSLAVERAILAASKVDNSLLDLETEKKLVREAADRAHNEASNAANAARHAIESIAGVDAAVQKTNAAAELVTGKVKEVDAALAKTGKATSDANAAARNANEANDRVTAAINSMQGKLDKVDEIEAAVFPYSLSVSGGAVYEKGTSHNVTVSWVMKKGSSVVTPDSSKVNGVPATGTSKVFNGVTTNTTYRVEATKGSITKTASTSVRFVNPSYLGVVPASFAASETAIRQLTKGVSESNSRTLSGANLANQKVCYAYPKSFGALVSIKDANNFDYINSYVRSELTINGEAYYVYVLKDATSVSGFKQVYS